jgi:hypothetical protein
MIEQKAAKFSSFEEAEEADRRYYAELTPARRLEILLRLMQRHREANHAPEGLTRVYRIVEFERR